MPDIQTIFEEGDLEQDSNIYNSTCSLDFLPTKQVLKWILIDYVYFRVCVKGYKDIELFKNDRGRTVEHRVMDLITVRIVDRAAEFEAQFKPRFENRNALLLFTPERAHLDFMDTLENIWSDGLANWGRLLGYIAFTGAYCMGCLDAGMVLLIETLVMHAVEYLDAKMGRWIQAHGGWRGFLAALNSMTLN